MCDAFIPTLRGRGTRDEDKDQQLHNQPAVAQGSRDRDKDAGVTH